jgi:hypothetical protein
VNSGDSSRPAPPLPDDMTPTDELASAVTPQFLATEIAEIRKHLATLRRHSDWLERQVTELRNEQSPNVRPIRPAT